MITSHAAPPLSVPSQQPRKASAAPQTTTVTLGDTGGVGHLSALGFFAPVGVDLAARSAAGPVRRPSALRLISGRSFRVEGSTCGTDTARARRT